MEVRIKNNGELVDATIEMIDGVMVVSPKVEKFEPKYGGTYYRPNFLRCQFVCYSGTADYNKIIYIKDYINKGWIFRTQEECQSFCDKLNQAINSVKP